MDPSSGKGDDRSGKQSGRAGKHSAGQARLRLDRESGSRTGTTVRATGKGVTLDRQPRTSTGEGLTRSETRTADAAELGPRRSFAYSGLVFASAAEWLDPFPARSSGWPIGPPVHAVIPTPTVERTSPATTAGSAPAGHFPRCAPSGPPPPPRAPRSPRRLPWSTAPGPRGAPPAAPRTSAIPRPAPRRLPR